MVLEIFLFCLDFAVQFISCCGILFDGFRLCGLFPRDSCYELLLWAEFKIDKIGLFCSLILLRFSSNLTILVI